MSIFQQYLDQLFIELKLADADPEYGYQIFRLQSEDQTRICRKPRRTNNDPVRITPPTEGRFVAGCLQPGTNKLILSFKQFPEKGGESIQRAAIAYHHNEIHKAAVDISLWLVELVTPLADNEFEKLVAVK